MNLSWFSLWRQRRRRHQCGRGGGCDVTRGRLSAADLLVDVLGRIPARSPPAPPLERSRTAVRGHRGALLLLPPAVAAVRLVVVRPAERGRRAGRSSRAGVVAGAAAALVLVTGGAGGAQPVGDLRGQLPPALLLVLGHAPLCALGRLRLTPAPRGHPEALEAVAGDGAEGGAGALLASPSHLSADAAAALTAITGIVVSVLIWNG